MHSTLLAFDIGTSGLKASLVDENLNIIRNVTTTYPTHHYPDGGCEQEAADWWMSAVRAMMMLRELAPEYVKRVDAIGVSGHMLGCLPMDSEGQTLRPAMIHADTRALAISNALRARYGRDYFYEICGNVLSPASTLCKTLWLKEHEPELYARTVRILQSKDYLVYRLTGHMDTTDMSDASHGLLMNLRTRQYDLDMFRNVGVDAEKFPEIRTSCELAGYLSEEAAGCLGLRAGIPVSVGGGDGACANIGAGVAKPGDFYLSLGTTAWIAGQMEEPFIDPQHRVFHIYTLDGHGCNVFGTEQCAGRSVSWAMELFDVASARAFDSAAATVPAGAGGLIYLPYLEGERSPVFDAQAQGVFFGMNTTHKREHFLRAVLEGTACGLSQILDVMRERQEIHDLRIIGGGAKSKLWKQILADVCNVTFHDVSTFSDSATSLGAAAAAGVAIGLFRDLPEACSHIRMSGDIEPDPAVQPVYALIKKRYAMLYPSLKEAFHTRAEIKRLPFQGSCLRSRLRGCCKFATTSPSRLRRATSPGRGGLWPHFASQMVFASPSAASRRPMQRSRDVEAQTTPWPPSRQMGLSASASPMPRWISCVPGLP